MAGEIAPITVFILSWNRPIYLWACLDSLYRYTRRFARFILVDNNSDDPLVRRVIAGFARRGMFYHIEWAQENLPAVWWDTVQKYRDLLGEYFAYIEADTVVFDTEPCWLSRFAALMNADPQLALLGSYIDIRDFVDPGFARRVAPHLDDYQRDGLIKAHSPERTLGPPPDEPIIEPFNPPGRLLMMRTSIFDWIANANDGDFYNQVKAAGLHAGIATGVRHRHLSLLNFFDYPDYDTAHRDQFMGVHPVKNPVP
jgi:hypothetical protein